MSKKMMLQFPLLAFVAAALVAAAWSGFGDAPCGQSRDCETDRACSFGCVAVPGGSHFWRSADQLRAKKSLKDAILIKCSGRAYDAPGCPAENYVSEIAAADRGCGYPGRDGER